jgi:hypothetical protein
MKKSKSPPSRIKYQSNHPTVSARLPKDKQEKLLALLRSLGVTLPQLLLHFIDEYEIKIMPIEAARKKGIDEGITKGYQQARDLFSVNYPCSKCGKEITVKSEDEKKAIRKFMTDSGWHHGDCE